VLCCVVFLVCMNVLSKGLGFRVMGILEGFRVYSYGYFGNMKEPNNFHERTEKRTGGYIGGFFKFSKILRSVILLYTHIKLKFFTAIKNS